MSADVTIVIPMHEGLPLTELALDAIDTLTRDVRYQCVVVDTCSSWGTRAALQRRVEMLPLDEAPWKWWQSPSDVAAVANGRALAAAAAQIPKEDRQVGLFVMHSDCLPLHDRWLAHLVGQLDPAGGVVAATYKTDAKGIHAMHCSGFLLSSAALERITPAMWCADAGRGWDAGDGVTAAIRGLGWRYAVNPWHTHRPHPRPGKAWLPCQDGSCEVAPDEWFADVNCDVSSLRAGPTPAWLHKGGGSWMTPGEMQDWVALARKALGLC